jgi:hypothetical protein
MIESMYFYVVQKRQRFRWSTSRIFLPRMARELSSEAAVELHSNGQTATGLTIAHQDSGRVILLIVLLILIIKGVNEALTRPHPIPHNYLLTPLARNTSTSGSHLSQTQVAMLFPYQSNLPIKKTTIASGVVMFQASIRKGATKAPVSHNARHNDPGRMAAQTPFLRASCQPNQFRASATSKQSCPPWHVYKSTARLYGDIGDCDPSSSLLGSYAGGGVLALTALS